ncbi:MAG: DLW-39 family protein [Micromonosporaceae bacterium]
MLKKILIIVGILGAAALIAKKVKDANEDRALWHEATTAPDLH